MIWFDEIVLFIKTYYQFIALGFSVLIFVLDVVILGIKNRQPLMTIYSKIREWLPGVVKAAEETSLKGEEKLSFAVNIIKGYLVKAFPKVDPDKYTRVIKELIEEMLSTPQKKKGE